MPKKPQAPIDLNTADEQVLVKKLNISPRLAKRIVALRPYQSVDQLNKIWGVDPQVLQRILPLVAVTLSEAPLPIPLKPSDPITQPESSEQEFLAEFQDEASAEQMTEKKEEQSAPARTVFKRRANAEPSSWKYNLLLALILLIGAYLRFTGLNWDEGQHQHPDERFISMVADAIRGVDGISAYFDTQNSTLNPLKYGSYTYGMFPLFLSRMVAEWVDMAGYDTITLVGRAMSGLFDLIAVWMLYFLGKRLYNRRVGLLAAALGVAAVLPIQLSHYFTVDSFSTIFVVASFYFAILAIPINDPEEPVSDSNLVYFGLFGLIVGLAGACKVNTLPVFGIIILAGVTKLITDWNRFDFRVTLKTILWGWFIAAVFVCISFRVFQPYAFAGPGFFGISLNQRWYDVIKEVVNQVAGNSDWPPNTHWTNRSITYAWTNMVTWGLGIPLGLAGWIGWGWAAAQIWKGDWRRHLLPFVWVALYFVWQNNQFWRYMRYFLPIYPFIILFAAWALVEIYDRTKESRARLFANGLRLREQLADWRGTWKAAASLSILGIVLAGTYVYALAFIKIYHNPITRVVASEWMLENIPGPMNVIVESPEGNHSYPVSISSRQVVVPSEVGSANIHVVQDGTLSKITTTDVRQIGVSIYFRLTSDEEGSQIITEGRLAINDDNQNEKQEISFGDIRLNAGQNYYFHYKVQSSSQFSFSSIALRNVDEGEGSNLAVNLSLEAQTPGTFQGSFALTPQGPLLLNRLTITDFHQVFVPTDTTLKVTIYKAGDDSTPLIETSQTLTYSQPGERLTPTFNFPSVEVVEGQSYQVRYEISNGAPLRLLGEAFTLETSWDDALPLNVNQYDVQGGIFTPLNLELYEPDTPEKREAMIKTLSESNYIVIPSNRAYDAMPRLPFRYPMTLKYYQALFDCECSGDALENRAYELKPPFKSPLGFELIATFENPPSLGFLVFPDQAADESFTVYDHPKVMIFKKSQDFSVEHVRSLLNSVNLDQVFFQTPMQYTKNPTAMQLPADRLLAQANGGTWSEMFDRNSLLNTNHLLGGILWYLLVSFIGLIVFPIVFRVFSGLPDRGYPLIRMAGLILTSWLAWFLAGAKILPFSQGALWLYIGLLFILCLTMLYRQREALLEYFYSHWKYMLFTEVVFLAIFLFNLSVRLGNPDLWHPWLGGEKPMDFAFFNAVLKAVYFPPEHPWFSGHYINYYYYGYVIAAIPTKLLGIVPSIAFNLILPTWFAMTGVGMFCIGFNLVSGLRRPSSRSEGMFIETADTLWRRLFTRDKFSRNLPYLVGAFALISVLFLGNLYEVRVLWKYLPEVAASSMEGNSVLQHWNAVVDGASQVISGKAGLPGGNDRWYFEASRPILHEGPDTPIAEFPYFTFLYADMHPHLLIMPFYALAFGWILNLLLWPISNEKWGGRILLLAAAGLIFGVFRPSHTWDFPTFLGLGGLAIVWNLWQTRSDSVQNTIKQIIIYVVAFAATAIALYLPFTHWFKTEYASLEPWRGIRTPLSDYLTVFGLQIFLMMSMLIRDLWPTFRSLFSNVSNEPRKKSNLLWYFFIGAILYALGALWLSDFQVVAFGLPLLVGMAYLILFDHDLPMLRKVTWILFGAGLFITLFVEVFVLKGDGGRSNTVFRFYNQAWFFLGLAMSLALVDLFDSLPAWTGPAKYVWVAALCILILSAASYPIVATGRKMADRWPNIINPPHSLDGAAFMLGDTLNPIDSPAIYNDNEHLLNLAHDYAAIVYMQDNVIGSPVFVEGHTEEYRWGSRFSIHTGLPSVVGWSWHVRQHNSLLDGAIVDRRIDEVNNFYNSEDVQLAEKFLDRYDVQYIIVGDLERAYYELNGINKFTKMASQGLLKMVFGDGTSETTTIFEVLK